MTKNEILEKLQQVVSKEPIKWHEDSEFRTQNRKWLKRSQAVALRVLRTLRENGLSQKDLAEKLNVSPQQVNKWLKGKENFTFETVDKLEEALNIELMSITGFESKQESNIKVVEVEYVKQQHYTPSEIRRKPVEKKSIPFVSNKVPLKDFNKAM